MNISTTRVAPSTFPQQRSGYSSTPTTPGIDPMLQRQRAPALIVDLAQADMARFQGTGETAQSDSGQDVRPESLPPIPNAARRALATRPVQARTRVPSRARSLTATSPIPSVSQPGRRRRRRRCAGAADEFA
jgi:hypothetical protein